jgi:hypothetical protein
VRLTPELALAYLAELSLDVRAAAVRSAPDGSLLAGAEGLREENADLSVRGRTHVLAVTLGPLAMPSLVRLDLVRIVEDLDGEPVPGPRNA